MSARCLMYTSMFLTFLDWSGAVSAQTQQWFSGWSALFATYRLDSRFSIYFDAQVRSNNQWERVQSYILRPGLHYQVNKRMIATVGYAFIGHHRTIDGVSGWGPESRIWEQYIINQSFNIGGHPTSLQHRFRLEQRFISKSVPEGGKLATDGYNFMQRFRYFARSIFPLAQTSPFRQGLFVSLQDELFFNVQNAPVTNGKFFDQNRFYTSIGERISPQFDVEIGYMNQFIIGKSNNTVNHILQLAGYLRLP